MGKWIGVDLDGTLAHYDGWRGEHHIGKPIPPMVRRVRRWLKKGIEVRIFTARACRMVSRDIVPIIRVIEGWCLENIGVVLKVTNEKDYGMVELWDDRAVQVRANTGRRVGR